MNFANLGELEKEALLKHIKKIGDNFNDPTFIVKCKQGLDEEIKNNAKTSLILLSSYFDKEIDLKALEQEDLDVIEQKLKALESHN